MINHNIYSVAIIKLLLLLLLLYIYNILYMDSVTGPCYHPFSLSPWVPSWSCKLVNSVFDYCIFHVEFCCGMWVCVWAVGRVVGPRNCFQKNKCIISPVLFPKDYYLESGHVYVSFSAAKSLQTCHRQSCRRLQSRPWPWQHQSAVQWRCSPSQPLR